MISDLDIDGLGPLPPRYSGQVFELLVIQTFFAKLFRVPAHIHATATIGYFGGHITCDGSL